MPELLLELFSEEIPARFQRRAADDLKKAVTNALVDAGLVDGHPVGDADFLADGGMHVGGGFEMACVHAAPAGLSASPFATVRPNFTG